MAHAFRAGTLATATDKAFEPEMTKSVAAAEALAPEANDRERMHICAAHAWLDGEWERATELWGRASIAYPYDLLALQFAHVGEHSLPNVCHGSRGVRSTSGGRSAPPN